IAEVFAAGETPLREGDLRRQPALATTLRGLAEGGARGYFYEGEFAQAFASALAQQGSPLTADDFAQYRAQWVEPISTAYRGKQVYQLPPATQGIAALQILNLLEGFDFSRIPEGGADYYHVIVGPVTLAFADRGHRRHGLLRGGGRGRPHGVDHPVAVPRLRIRHHRR